MSRVATAVVPNDARSSGQFEMFVHQIFLLTAVADKKALQGSLLIARLAKAISESPSLKKALTASGYHQYASAIA